MPYSGTWVQYNYNTSYSTQRLADNKEEAEVQLPIVLVNLKALLKLGANMREKYTSNTLQLAQRCTVRRWYCT